MFCQNEVLRWEHQPVRLECENMKKLKLVKSKMRGFAVPLAMVAIMILLAMGVGLLNLGLTSRTYSARTAADIAARCAADAGVTKALFEMNEKLKVKPWNGSSLPEVTNENLPFCDATFSYTVTGNPGSGYVIEAVGTCGHAERRISCTLRLQGPFEFAVFGDEGAELKNSALVDWYNFGADDDVLKVGTNSVATAAIILKNSATVNGDVVVGLGGNPDTVISDAGATITGEARALREKNELLPVAAPDWLQSLPSSGIIQDDATVTSSAKYSSIDLKNGKTLVINGDITLYVIGEIILGNSFDPVFRRESRRQELEYHQ